jgi:hypothetical protein
LSVCHCCFFFSSVDMLVPFRFVHGNILLYMVAVYRSGLYIEGNTLGFLSLRLKHFFTPFLSL